MSNEVEELAAAAPKIVEVSSAAGMNRSIEGAQE
jgi:hypothetical protein